jgi:muramidase (phage lysozyme)
MRFGGQPTAIFSRNDLDVERLKNSIDKCERVWYNIYTVEGREKEKNEKSSKKLFKNLLTNPQSCDIIYM